MNARDIRRPNIVMILTDDHAAHAIGAYGSVVNTTPRIDEIAGCGWRFDNCFATNALCSPSRASILTGTYSHVNGVTTLSTPIDASQPTFISQLRQAGYRTAMVGKWHMGDGDGHNPQNFDYWNVVIGQGEYHNPHFLSEDGLRVVEGYATDIITDLSIDWVEGLPGDDPWCVLIYHKAPHRPWEPDDKHAELYGEPIPVPATFTEDGSTRTASARRAAMRLAEQLMYSSDQGFFLGDHGWFDKRFMYEESLRMPLVLSYPRRLAAGKVHAGIVTNVDMAQTILDACGVPHHPRMHGRSFWGDLTGEDAPPPAEGVYYRYWEHDDIFHKAPAHYGYRTRHHKIIYFYNDGLGLPGTGMFVYPGEWELYDLDADPNELRNVYADPAYREIREELKRQLWRAQQALGDTPHPSQPRPPGV